MQYTIFFRLSGTAMCDKFIGELKKEGYEKVELIDTANGKFMTKREAIRLF